jgi:hypothetical protein
MACGGSQTGAYEGEGRMHGGFLGNLLGMAVPLIGKLFGAGKMDKDAHDQLMHLMKGKHSMKGSGSVVGGSSHEMAAVPAAKPKRAVGSSDGRRRRAEIVRKVMSEKGLSMIEASTYVKAHGLYK